MAHILVVHTENAVRDSLRDALVNAGHTVALVPDGYEAIRWTSETEADLVILNVQLPENGEFEFLTWMRTQPDTALIPIVSIGAPVADPSVFDGWPSGKYFVIKPFSHAALVDLLPRLLQGDIAPGLINHPLHDPVSTGYQSS